MSSVKLNEDCFRRIFQLSTMTPYVSFSSLFREMSKKCFKTEQFALQVFYKNVAQRNSLGVAEDDKSISLSLSLLLTNAYKRYIVNAVRNNIGHIM